MTWFIYINNMAIRYDYINNIMMGGKLYKFLRTN